MRTDMDVVDTSAASEPSRMEGKFKATVICCFLGLGCLVSWNSMLTTGDYYHALFPDYHFERVLTIVYEPFALGVLAILTCYEARINTRKRNLVGYVVFCTSTFGLIVIDLASLGKGGIGSFIATCVMVAAFGVADAHCQGEMVGDLSYMCPEFLQSFFAGLAGSGALTSVLRLISKAAFDKTENGLRKGAMLFLAILTFMELVCILLYGFIFPEIPIVKYYRRKAASEGSETVIADLAAAGLHTNDDTITEDPNDRLSTKRLLLKNLDYLSGLFFTYAEHYPSSLSIIP